MTSELLLQRLANNRNFYNTGQTKSYEFRLKQLKLFKATILKYENEIGAALYADLKKSPEEAYATETGLLLAELNTTIKNLYSWMKPRSSGTDLVNIPSTGKIYRDSLGVVLIIAPWNYPLQLLLIPLVGAMAGGNCAVLKPSELAPATAAVSEKIINEVFPPEYVQLVQGDGAEVIPQMMNQFRFDHVMYTGSVAVGKIIYQLAAKDLVPVTLELGGKSPVVVEADANLNVAARRIILGKFTNAGQTCIAPDYVLVHDSVKDKLVQRLKETIYELYGQNAAESYDYGKIINEKRFDKLISYFNEGNLITGGQHDRAALFIAPSLMDNVSLDASVMREEIFGPVLPILTFHNFEGAVSIIQKNPNPLSFYIFTSSKQKQEQWVSRISFGGGCINNTAWHFTNHHMPFGGVGNSGIGSIHGKYTFETFTRLKSVMKTPVWIDPRIKYPSFKGKLKLFRMLIR
jgi:aldehyde dehydrogenase (NAD+)